jgi:eukaryotic-like serine/threonine-protein kinase
MPPEHPASRRTYITSGFVKSSRAATDMTCPHCRAETSAASGRCVVCSGALPVDPSVETFLSPSGPLPAGPTIASGPAPAPSGASSGVLGPGQLFASRYRIERVLGTGGMGAVYRAIDVELDVPVALKVIRSENLADPQTGRDFEQRFKQELLLARQVTHQNVLRIHDLGDCGGTKYITMPLIEGSDLHAILARGPMPFERVLSLAQQIVSGLAAAHDVGIMHRDLKPQNILVDSSDRAYISDFGLAKSYEATALGLTRAGDFIGTPRYIAPEIVEGQPADHRSDLYAIGLILYEMASGELPFKGNSVMEVLMQRVRKTPKDLRQVKPEIPEFFSRIVMRCLAKDPADRYQRAREIVADLDAARPPSKSRASQSISINLPLPTRRGWVAAAVLVAAIAALAALPPVRALFFGGTTAAEGIPPASQQKLLAVLPFRTIGSADELEHIGVGVTEGLTAKLFGMSALTVAPASVAERVDASEPKHKIARQLGSNLLVTGTVQGGGGRIAITVNLEEPLADRHVWTEQFSGDPRDLLTLQDQIFARLVEALDVHPSTAEHARSISRPTENVAAYDLYLKGRNAMRGQQDRRNVEAAVGFYEEAIEVDPRFALAFAGLADAAVQMYRETKDRLWADKAVFASQQAKRLNEDLLEVRLALGNAYFATGRTNEAIAELTSALELAPNSDDAYRRLASAYRRAGNNEEAVRMVQKAVDLNPYYWHNHNALGGTYWLLGDYEKAAAAFRRVIQLEPDNVNGHNDLGAAYLQTGRYREASEAFEKSLALQPTADSYTNLGIALAWQGRFPEALPAFEKAVELAPNVDGWLSNLADGYRWVGQPDKAKETYEQAIALAYKALQVNPSDAVTRSHLGTYLAKKGDVSEGLKLVLEAQAASPEHVLILYDVAVVRRLAGQDAEALTALRSAIKAGYPARFVQDDPDWKRLAADARFQALVKESQPATGQ